MIFDRTQNDVDTAIRLRNEKVKFDPVTMQPINPEELTESEIATLEKGTITYNTLNRIETKQQELADMLNAYGYMVNIETKNNWNANDIFNEENHLRILQNLSTLKNAFYVLNVTPVTPIYMFGFKELNDIEKILVDIEHLVKSMINSWVYMGNDYYMGGIA